MPGRETTASQFVAASSPPTLAVDTVHLWHIDLAQPTEQIDELAAELRPSELVRAAGFRFARHRRRFIVRRAVMRRLLAAYQDVALDTIRFELSPHGKPSLSGPANDHPDGPLTFNLSDSKDVAVLAVARGPELGVDIEVVRNMPDARQVAESFFAEAEIAALAAVPKAQRDEAFFTCWTRKEAYIKATGIGLSTDLGSFVVSLRPDVPCRVLSIDGDPVTAEDWQMISFRCPPTVSNPSGAVGAVASRRPRLDLDGCFRNDGS